MVCTVLIFSISDTKSMLNAAVRERHVLTVHINLIIVRVVMQSVLLMYQLSALLETTTSKNVDMNLDVPRNL